MLHHGHFFFFSGGTRNSNSGPDGVLTKHLPSAICSFLFMYKPDVFTWEDFGFLRFTETGSDKAQNRLEFI